MASVDPEVRNANNSYCTHCIEWYETEYAQHIDSYTIQISGL